MITLLEKAIKEKKEFIALQKDLKLLSQARTYDLIAKIELATVQLKMLEEDNDTDN